MPTATPQAQPGISIKKLFEMIDFTPHSRGQWEYCLSNARFNIPCCGRRWGKSQAAGHRMTARSFVPNSYNWIVGPTYKLGEKEFRVVWDDYNKLGLLKKCRKSYSPKQGDMRIKTPWNSVIEVVSADNPDSLLGEGLSHVIMSEAARHSRSTWEQFIEPALSDLLGTADFPSTPKGYNWYHGMWQLGQDNTKNTEMYASWHFPSWTNSVRYPGGEQNTEIERIRSDVSKQWFDQEYAALFTAITGAIYDEWDERIHVKPHTFNPDWPNYLAFDYGFANPFVCLDIQIDPSDRVYVWREYYHSNLTTFEHANVLKNRDNPPGYHIDGAWGDHRGPDEAQTLGMLFTHVDSYDIPWKTGVEEIKRLLKVDLTGSPRMLVDPSCVNLIRQMQQLHVKQTNRADSPDPNEFTGDRNIQHKIDDHAADALRYFVGPYYVLGAGTSFADIYGQTYRGSESEDFFRVHSGITLDGRIRI